jgi:hypothetical protein
MGEASEKVTKEALLLIREGWYQVSRKSCIVAQLPEGKTGRLALLEVKEKQFGHEEWVWGMSEAAAGDFFLRCHAGNRGEAGKKKVVPKEVFDEFRRLGGSTYHQARYEESRCPLCGRTGWNGQPRTIRYKILDKMQHTRVGKLIRDMQATVKALGGPVE